MGDGFAVPVESQAVSVKKNQKKKKKKNTAISRSWVSLDHEGKTTILDVDKYAIMQRVQINARDLRLLDPLLSYPSTILGRERVIVLNLEHIKSIITADESLKRFRVEYVNGSIYLSKTVQRMRHIVKNYTFDKPKCKREELKDPMDENVVPIVEELQRRLPSTNSLYQGQGEEEEPPTTQNELPENEFPFEFRALEVALEAICSFLDARTRELETETYPALDELTSKISSLNLDRVRKLKSAMTRLTNRVQKVRDELEQLLDDDDDMAELYLSRKVAGTPESGSGTPIWFLASPKDYSKLSKTSRASAITIRGENDVEELEMLLEAYFMQIEGTLNKLITLREYIDDTEDYINIQLDNHRNQLIQLELFLSSGTVCLSIYSLVTAIFGMNIPYTWKEDHEHVFKWVVIVTGIVCASIYLSLSSYARYKGLVGS